MPPKNGVNDRRYLADWAVDFPRTYHELIGRLDSLLKDIPNWFGDRHPNPDVYQVIGAALTAYLAPLIRSRSIRKEEGGVPTIRQISF